MHGVYLIEVRLSTRSRKASAKRSENVRRQKPNDEMRRRTRRLPFQPYGDTTRFVDCVPAGW